MIPTSNRIFLAAYCLDQAGLRVDADKAYLLESRLAPVARREGFASTEALIEAVRAGGDERLGWAMVEAMVLPEAEFFRDRAVFEALVDEVLPPLLDRRAGAPIRVWSAACGTGQEIYSLALLLADTPGLSEQVELLASDLSERSLEKAQAGVYSQFEVQRGLPARTLVRHFEKQGEGFVLAPRVRQMIRWRRANLIGDVAALGQFDLILCRNLLPQLAPEAQTRVLTTLGRALAPGGRLVLGPRDRPGPAFAPVAADLALYAVNAGGDPVRTAA